MIVYMIFLHTIIAPKERNFVLVGVGVRLKRFFEPTFLDNQLWFWKYSPIFLLLLRPNLGPFLPFLGLLGLFLGLGSGPKPFLGPTYID